MMVQTERRHRVLTVTDLFTIEQDQTTGGYNTYSMVDSALAGALELGEHGGRACVHHRHRPRGDADLG